MKTKSIKVPAELTRAGVISVEKSGDKTSKRISISSDTPYLRYDWYNDEDYWEVLSHKPGDVGDARLKAGLTALFNHRRDYHLGRATTYENDGHRINVGNVDDMIWSESSDAQTKKKDVESGALVGTSVGYSILDEGTCIGAKDGIPIYEFKWEPHEFSFCTIEADITVGAGRDNSPQRREEGTKEPKLKEISIKSEETVDIKPKLVKTPPTTQQPKAKNMETLTDEEKAAQDKIRTEERAAFKAKCKKIRDHVAAIKSDKWRATAEPIATKYCDDEADFEAFRTECNNAIDKARELEEAPHIEVVGERGGPRNGQRQPSIGAQLIRSKSFVDQMKARGRRAISFESDISVLGIRGKVALAERAGFNSSDLTSINVAPQQNLIALGTQRLTVMDMIAPGTTSAAAIPYPRENSLGLVNGVAPVAPAMARAQSVGERGIKPLWEPDLTTQTANVHKIAIITKLPDEFLADFPAMQSYVDERLPYMVDIETEFQILYGDGLNNNLQGITSAPGIQTRAIDVTSDATTAASLKKGITDIQVNAYFEPDGYVFHPYDWETASLLKDTNGRFLAGGPFYVPYTNGVFMEMYTFWGKPVVITTSCTYGKPLVGCWKLGAQYFMREGMRLEMTNSNEDDFRRNLMAVRAEHRLALAVYRPVAFLEFTGFPART